MYKRLIIPLEKIKNKIKKAMYNNGKLVSDTDLKLINKNPNNYIIKM
jgi:hypothetical protein